MLDDPLLWQACFCGCLAAAALLSHGWAGVTRSRGGLEWTPGGAKLAVVGAVVIGLSAWFGFSTSWLPAPSRFFNYAALYGGFMVAVVCAVTLTGLYVWRQLRTPTSSPRDDGQDISLVLLCATACTVVVALSFSFPIYEPMAMPTVVVLFAVPLALAARAGDSGKVRIVGRVCALIAALLVVHTAAFKRFYPFDFASWCEAPLTTERASSKISKLKGLSLGTSTVRSVEGVVDAIEKAGAGPNDLYVYPHMALFYYLTDRIPPTHAFVHWWDVAAETVLTQDLETLKQHPPKVVVVRKLRDEERRINRMTSVMSDYIDTMLSSYTMVYRAEPFAGEPILVYVRAGDRASANKVDRETARRGP
jgi:hypothetical protein